MTALLLFAFLLACLIGAIAAWHVPAAGVTELAPVLLLLSTAGLAGALSVAAEAGSAPARYLGLFAVLLASAAFTGTAIAARRQDKAQRSPIRP